MGAVIILSLSTAYLFGKSSNLAQTDSNLNTSNETAELRQKVKVPVSLGWNNLYKEALTRFIDCPTEGDKGKVKQIINKMVDKVEFRKKPFSVKVFYKV